MGNFLSWKTKKNYKIMMSGLDGVGKTTILYQMKVGEVVASIPTIGLSIETIKVQNFEIMAWDIGGRSMGLALLKHYFPEVNAIVFVIDSIDVVRIDEAKEFLDKLINKDYVKNPVLLVMANKQDLPNGMSIEEIKKKLEIDKYKDLKAKRITPTSAITGLGLKESLDWVLNELSLEEYKAPLDETVSDVNNIKNGIMSFFKSFSSS